MSSRDFPAEFQEDLKFMKNQVTVYHGAIKMYKEKLQNAFDRSQKTIIFISAALALAELVRTTYEIDHWIFNILGVVVNTFIAMFIAYMKFNRYVERIKLAEAGQSKVSFLGEEFKKASIITLDLWIVLNDMFASATKEFEGLMEPSEQEKAARRSLKSHLKQLGRDNKLKHVLADTNHGLSKKERKLKQKKELPLNAPLALTDGASVKASKPTDHKRGSSWSNTFNIFSRSKRRQSNPSLSTVVDDDDEDKKVPVPTLKPRDSTGTNQIEITVLPPTRNNAVVNQKPNTKSNKKRRNSK